MSIEILQLDFLTRKPSQAFILSRACVQASSKRRIFPLVDKHGAEYNVGAVSERNELLCLLVALEPILRSLRSTARGHAQDAYPQGGDHPVLRLILISKKGISLSIEILQLDFLIRKPSQAFILSRACV